MGPVESSIDTDLILLLSDLKNDEDDDVKFYAKKAAILVK
jgi:hypothetical protein